MTSFIILLQQTIIDDKIKNASDSGYQIGVLIGSYLPFIILVGFAYWTYNSIKKNNKND